MGSRYIAGFMQERVLDAVGVSTKKSFVASGVGWNVGKWTYCRARTGP